MLSRSRLTLAAFALLATSGVMVAGGAGPDQNKRNDTDAKLNIRIDIGDDHDHRGHGNWERRGPHPRPVYRVEPVIVRPVVVQPVYAELAPHALDLQAYQSGDTVIVLARGENTTAGFTTSLERERGGDGRNDGSARITLRNYGPVRQTFRAEVCSPFSVSGGFETRERLSEIRICVAGEERCIPVQRIDQMQRN